MINYKKSQEILKKSKINIKNEIILAKESLIPAIDRSKITKMLYDSGAFFVSKVIVEPVVERVVRDISILKHKDDYSMFEAFIDSQSIDNDMKKSILKQAKNIIG